MSVCRIVLVLSFFIASCSGSGGGSLPPQPPSYVIAIPWNQEIMIIWDDVPDAVSFNLYWSTTPGVNKDTGMEIQGVSSPYLHSTLVNGIGYYYVVTSLNSDGMESKESIEVNAVPSVGYPFALPDTGQNLSYTDIFGEDADYTINPPSYTDNADGTITDNITGLMWQRTDDGVIRDWDEAVMYCRDLTLGGYSDWRLPSIKELLSIVHYERFSPAVDPVFSGIKSDHYWSSDINIRDSSRAWYVFFYDGYVFNHYRAYYNHVICVRDGAFPPERFVDNADGTVTDLRTGLMWQKDDSNTGLELEGAINYCEGMTLQSHKDWRLPNIRELQSIVNYSAHNPSINIAYFPDTLPTEYWSSTFHTAHTPYGWIVNFEDGYVGSMDINSPCLARCVRSIND